ncbi:MAG: hypothetical protein CGU28_00920 [Candidatus Dactylopiibacterium carminicum]|uniref:DUF484 domain-containing protein n=1 Tax=Candidatus Dactylopiibacterium carminicum TaxID=857335 RepID=A0A272EVU9_9RHOO|nr:DUF484 family protein [Candidatus Dactylopiibacterium carminicum]KAF7599591.1 DUF484 domain-containing protein [Candidatus Dactylopiibacterium carminicum]PAS94238.1 MAG: hypothetical protein CGU29_04260 [Candidatus Dactylopiibacterium carminicum]PAS98435.1 MAG: hypothetical protein CGU28_00920 [Candidatus Dactylopiibacterium carminicum]PAS99593.1 MAG: hypothetical protein BSR46_06930 [Candidatus Dactylopiibacterium carminicum]
MTPQDIVEFLSSRPEFFSEHSDLLAQLSVPHPTHGHAISLTERQVLTLREKLAQVQSKLAELVSFGEENDVIASKVHRLSMALLLADEFEAVSAIVYAHLQEDFAVPHVALRVWNSILKRDSEEFADVSEELRFLAADLHQPYTGPAQHEEILGWFGESSGLIASMALIPLRRDAQVFGMLALGSEDPQRFFPGMGTLYVERIGDLVGAAVLKHVG